jgi:hypothetical protein
MNERYEATDEQLLKYLPRRVLELAKQPFLRPGGVDLDIRYSLAVWEAKDRVSVAALAINNPGLRHVWFPPIHPTPWIGLVRYEDGSTTWWLNKRLMGLD